MTLIYFPWLTLLPSGCWRQRCEYPSDHCDIRKWTQHVHGTIHGKEIYQSLSQFVCLSLALSLSDSLSLAISLSSTCRFLCKPCCRPSPPLRPNPPSQTLTLPPSLTLQAWDDELAKGNKFEDIYEKRKQQLSAHKEKENATRAAPLISANPSLIAEPVPAPVPVEVPVVVPVVVTPTPEPVAPIVPAVVVVPVVVPVVVAVAPTPTPAPVVPVPAVVKDVSTVFLNLSLCVCLHISTEVILSFFFFNAIF